MYGSIYSNANASYLLSVAVRVAVGLNMATAIFSIVISDLWQLNAPATTHQIYFNIINVKARSIIS